MPVFGETRAVPPTPSHHDWMARTGKAQLFSRYAFIVVVLGREVGKAEAETERRSGGRRHAGLLADMDANIVV